MTLGYWRAEAHTQLRVTVAAMRGHKVPNPADAYALIAARSTLYTQLARATQLLIGGRPVPEVPARAGAALLLGRHGQTLTRFYVGVHAAAVVDHQYPHSAENTSDLTQAAHRAADAIAVIGDILASHVTPGRQASTPEGEAIRRGGGVQAAMAAIARLSIDAIALDRQLPAWLNRGDDPFTASYRPVLDVATWVANSRLGAIARALISHADRQPMLLDELDINRGPQHPAPAVTTVDEARTAIAAVRTWLWQHPDQATLAHLQLATQIGLAVHTRTDDPGTTIVRRWRAAAVTAAQLRGTPATDVGGHAEAELAEVLRWARTSLNQPDLEPDAEQTPRRLAAITAQLPALAGALQRGLANAVQRKDLFVGSAELHRPAGSLIYRATQRWRPATPVDELVRELAGSLGRLRRPLGDGASPVATPPAAQAFPLAPRLEPGVAGHHGRPARSPGEPAPRRGR